MNILYLLFVATAVLVVMKNKKRLHPVRKRFTYYLRKERLVPESGSVKKETMVNIFFFGGNGEPSNITNFFLEDNFNPRRPLILN